MTQLDDLDRAPAWWFPALLVGMLVVVGLAAIGLYTVWGWIVPPASALHWVLSVFGGCAILIGIGLLFWAVTESTARRGE